MYARAGFAADGFQVRGRGENRSPSPAATPEPEVFIRYSFGTVIASVALDTRVLRCVGFDEDDVARRVMAWALTA